MTAFWKNWFFSFGRCYMDRGKGSVFLFIHHKIVIMFKRIILIVFAGLLYQFSLFAQDAEKLVVPDAVKNKMLGMFPQTQAVPVEWVKDGSNYKGSLKIMEKPAFAVFDSTGNVVRIEKRLHVSYLPKKVTTQLNKLYPGNEILDIYEMTDAAGKKTYKTTFKYTQTEVFNPEGVVVK
jgi:hypothetical protein